VIGVDWVALYTPVRVEDDELRGELRVVWLTLGAAFLGGFEGRGCGDGRVIEGCYGGRHVTVCPSVSRDRS
jgi:hypothetical protein